MAGLLRLDRQTVVRRESALQLQIQRATYRCKIAGIMWPLDDEHDGTRPTWVLGVPICPECGQTVDDGDKRAELERVPYGPTWVVCYGCDAVLGELVPRPDTRGGSNVASTQQTP
jgi:hypothetical protein